MKAGLLVILGLVLVGIFVVGRDRMGAPVKTPQGDAKIAELLGKAGILPPYKGTEAVDFTLKDPDGAIVRLSDHRGKIVFLNFWATWCPSCVGEMAAMERLYKRFRERDFVMVAVSLRESPERVGSFFRERGLSFSAALDEDGEVGNRYAVRAVPTTFIVGKGGYILGSAIGPRDWDGDRVTELLEHLVGGQVELRK